MKKLFVFIISFVSCVQLYAMETTECPMLEVKLSLGESISQLEVSPNGRRFAAVVDNEVAFLTQRVNGQLVDGGRIANVDNSNPIALGNTIFCAGNNSVLRIWKLADIAKGSYQVDMGEGHVINDIAISSDDKYIGIERDGSTISCFKTDDLLIKENKPLFAGSFSNGVNKVQSVSFDSSGAYLMCGALGQYINLLNADRLSAATKLESIKGPALNVDEYDLIRFDKRGRTFQVECKNGTRKLYRLTQAENGEPRLYNYIILSNDHADNIAALDVDEGYFALATNNYKNIELHDGDAWEISVPVDEKLEAPVTSMKFAKDYLLAGLENGDINFYKLSLLKEVLRAKLDQQKAYDKLKFVLNKDQNK